MEQSCFTTGGIRTPHGDRLRFETSKAVTVTLCSLIRNLSHSIGCAMGVLYMGWRKTAATLATSGSRESINKLVPSNQMPDNLLISVTSVLRPSPQLQTARNWSL